MINFVRRTSAPDKSNKYYIRKASGGYSPCLIGKPNADGNKSALANCVGYAWGRVAEYLDNPLIKIGYQNMAVTSGSGLYHLCIRMEEGRRGMKRNISQLRAISYSMTKRTQKQAIMDLLENYGIIWKDYVEKTGYKGSPVRLLTDVRNGSKSTLQKVTEVKEWRECRDLMIQKGYII